jgi:hypothetical protein
MLLNKMFYCKNFAKYKILYSLKKGVLESMDARLLIVFLPVLAAASWALYNIGRVALQQLNRMASR